MPETPPLATVVVVTWNGAHLLGPCLTSLRNQSLPRRRYEVVVVDNDSRDGTADLLREEFPDVTVVRSPSNVGFAGGVDLALQRVTSPFAVLVNNDAEVDHDFLVRLLAPFQQPDGERVAAVTAHVLLAGLWRRVEPGEQVPEVLADRSGRRYAPVPAEARVGLRLVNSTGSLVGLDGNGFDRGWLDVDGEHVYAPDVFAFCGAAAALRMAAVRGVGGFAAAFFLYYEDTDLSWRLRRAGWTVRYAAGAIATHKHSASSGVGSPVFRFHNERNRLLTVLRNAPADLVLVACARFAVRALLDVRQPDLVRLRLRVVRSLLRLLPDALRVRRHGGPLLRPDRAGGGSGGR